MSVPVKIGLVRAFLKPEACCTECPFLMQFLPMSESSQTAERIFLIKKEMGAVYTNFVTRVLKV